MRRQYDKKRPSHVRSGEHQSGVPSARRNTYALYRGRQPHEASRDIQHKALHFCLPRATSEPAPTFLSVAPDESRAEREHQDQEDGNTAVTPKDDSLFRMLIVHDAICMSPEASWSPSGQSVGTLVPQGLRSRPARPWRPVRAVGR